jgi:hypothetical protein
MGNPYRIIRINGKGNVQKNTLQGLVINQNQLHPTKIIQGTWKPEFGLFNLFFKKLNKRLQLHFFKLSFVEDSN